ncbi:MAG TPA: hypothetical protein VEM13_09860 [Gemmatimonadales bacterium]|nr:hypothetical protein [Gemmatimonadales bacterium]
MSAPSLRPGDGVTPLLVVTDVAARLIRRGLLAPAEAAAGGWVRTRVLVFRAGPVVCEVAAAASPRVDAPSLPSYVSAVTDDPHPLQHPHSPH